MTSHTGRPAGGGRPVGHLPTHDGQYVPRHRRFTDHSLSKTGEVASHPEWSGSQPDGFGGTRQEIMRLPLPFGESGTRARSYDLRLVDREHLRCGDLDGMSQFPSTRPRAVRCDV